MTDNRVKVAQAYLGRFTRVIKCGFTGGMIGHIEGWNSTGVNGAMLYDVYFGDMPSLSLYFTESQLSFDAETIALDVEYAKQ